VFISRASEGERIPLLCQYWHRFCVKLYMTNCIRSCHCLRKENHMGNLFKETNIAKALRLTLIAGMMVGAVTLAGCSSGSTRGNLVGGPDTGNPGGPGVPGGPGDPNNPGNPDGPGDPNNPGNPGGPGDPNNPG